MSSSGMDHMLMCFERDATNWLRTVKAEFDSTNQQFDDSFRKMFIQTSTDRLSATYWQFVLESQLRKRADVNAVPLRGRSLPAAAPTPRVSRINRLGANTIKSEATARQSTTAGDNIDSSPEIPMNMFDSAINADLNENGVDSTVGIADENASDDDDDDNLTTQQPIESKPNLSYSFRDRNSPIFARRRQAINALIDFEKAAARQRQRPRPTPRKRQPLEKKFKCDHDQCTYTASYKSRLNEHKLSVHSAEKPFQCDICKLRVCYRHSLKKHLLQRHGIILLS